ncbi:MAG: DEAD/DEAH box helicase family protein [Planctomycetes bacterium]|nr:DEAD/DEAH box helicase family protein [Planctomycetota bacterium]
MAKQDKNLVASELLLCPHQKKFVDAILRSAVPARFILSAPPGTGKGVAIASAALALSSRNKEFRCLVIAPQPIQKKWQGRLKKFARMDATIMTPQKYRYRQGDIHEPRDIWSGLPVAITSLAFFTSEGHLDELTRAGWDLIIIDEANIGSEPSQLTEVTKKIWTSSRVAIAVALTETPNHLNWLSPNAKIRKVHWEYSALFPSEKESRRRIHCVNYKMTKSEREGTKRITKLLCQPQNKVPIRVSGYALLRRLRSSLYAFDQTLRRLIANRAEFELYANERYSPNRTEVEAWEDIVIPAGISAADIDYDALRQLTSILEEERKDLKFECFLGLIESRGLGKAASTAIMTEYSDTAEYIEYLAKSRGLNAILVRKNASLGEQERVLQAAKSGPTLLISTTETSWLGFGFADQMVHYDLPLTPEGLLKRFISIEKAGTDHKCMEHFFLIASDKAADEALQKLLKGVRNLMRRNKHRS